MSLPEKIERVLDDMVFREPTKDILYTQLLKSWDAYNMYKQNNLSDKAKVQYDIIRKIIEVYKERFGYEE